MGSRNRSIPPTRFLPNPVDHLCRPIDPSVLRIAIEIAPQAVSYGERLLRDSAVAMTLFEEVAASVSRTLRQQIASGPLHVQEMGRYLFRSYLRRITAARRTQPRLLFAAEDFTQSCLQRNDTRTLEAAVLLRELRDCCDSITRPILQRRLEGCSWKQVEQEFGISANAAALRLKRVVRHLQTPSSPTARLVLPASSRPRSSALPCTVTTRLSRAS